MRLILIFISSLFVFSVSAQERGNAYPPMTKPIQLTSNFAEYRKNHFHSGIDISVTNRTNMNIYSVWEGYISRIRFNSASYGRAVYITHPNGYSSVYGHLSSFAPFIDSLVTAYQYENKVFETDIQIPAGTVPVKKGQILGVAGNSGYSFGAHLHFEIRDAATDDPVNPLKFLPLDDLMEPQFKQIGIYQLQSGGFLPAKANYYPVIKKGSFYTTNSEIIVPDTFFLGFDVQDYQSALYYRLLPNIIEVFIDDVSVWKINFDRFSFEQTGTCRGIFDHYAGLNNKKQIVTTYTGNHLRQGFFKQFSNDGLFVLPDFSQHTLTVKATDTEFNTSVFKTTIRKGNIKPLNTGKYIIKTKYFHEISTQNLIIKCDTGTFYGDLALDKPLINEFQRDNKLFWEIGYNEMPLIKPIHVFFDTANAKNDKLLFVKMANNKIEKAWKPILLNTGQFTVDIDRYGVFCHFYDTIPPKIEKTNILQNSILPNQNEITFVVTDNSGTLLNYNAYINGEWALMIYDLKYDLFTIPFKYSQRKNIKSLKVEFIDLAGNTTTKEYFFAR